MGAVVDPAASADRGAAIRDLARTRENAGDLTGALALYDRVRQMEPESAPVHFRIGVCLEKLGRWTEAITFYRRATTLDPLRSYWRYRLGYTLELAGDLEASKAATTRAIEVDPKAPVYASDMLRTEPRRFLARKVVCHFIEHHLDEIESRARRSWAEYGRHAADGVPPVAYVYWGQGIETAPPVVRLCAGQLSAVTSDVECVWLDDRTLGEYVTIAAGVRARIGSNRTHLSDLIRLALLERYGGTWLDATVFVTPAFEQFLSKVATADFFGYRYSDPRIASWFMTSRPGGIIVSMLKAALDIYWERNTSLLDYYLLHHVFEALYWIAPSFRTAWEASARRSAGPPHELRTILFDEYDPTRLSDTLARSAAHKLSRHRQVTTTTTGTNFGELLRRSAIAWAEPR